MEKYRIIQLVGDPKTEIGTFYIQRRVFFFFWKNYTKEKYYSLSEAQDALSEIIYKQKKYRAEKDPKTGLLRIIALKDFSDVKAGDKGGLIETRDNLSQEGDCWVYDEALVKDNARVFGNAKVYGDAFVHGHAEISGNAQIYEKAEISGYIQVSGNAKVHGDSALYGYTKYTIIE